VSVRLRPPALYFQCLTGIRAFLVFHQKAFTLLDIEDVSSYPEGFPKSCPSGWRFDSPEPFNAHAAEQHPELIKTE